MQSFSPPVVLTVQFSWLQPLPCSDQKPHNCLHYSHQTPTRTRHRPVHRGMVPTEQNLTWVHAYHTGVSLTYRTVHPQSHPLFGVVECSDAPEHLWQERCGVLNEQCEYHHGPLRTVRRKLLRLTHCAASGIVPRTGDIVGKIVQVDLKRKRNFHIRQQWLGLVQHCCFHIQHQGSPLTARFHDTQ